ncbi:enoyl-CoA hydratase/isomerase family protein [Brevibacterium casei]|uniref:enoyl-CoA hydratase/isomerase family protein n=1 Tax=Brevibacterium casei TaxID=33889 RepID=UPI00103D69E2|nr:enoyl-CoA hydratase/isomerase family protein [Brevibacterium casei]MCT1448434.1 enoyl-CoA hydratase/isomerase family protein [Brevibacterium casei]MCT2182799.1 enoyl-CoA hydratase/isomerase family protein [Brevibacterium casei]QZE25932.1 enoyl-CoA hydratase/isomerase family protein [Brevibacterium casei]
MSDEHAAVRTEDLLVERDDGVLTVTFNRPEARNAMTWEMYQGLAEACDAVDADPAVRVMVLRGAGGRAFVAGTDIAQFTDFDGPAGVAYESRISEVLARLRAVDVPVIAAIDGYCVGGGLGIAACADLRLASPGSRFGVPIARTLGNCLSGDTLGLLIALLGRGRVVDMLLRARFIDADEALTAGFLGTVTDDVDATTAEWAATLKGHAPLTMWSVKEIVRRLSDLGGGIDDADVVERIYGSEDFHEAVRAFIAKEDYEWTGR